MPKQNTTHTPERMLDLSIDDVLFFHSRGTHGNNPIDSAYFNAELFRPDCSACQQRETDYIDMLKLVEYNRIDRLLWEATR